ncbi:hypothetical protein [Paraburkholderia phenoliruptrix]|uniref:hypothetical protein n=1 Tax=Paraburkholderia phenoliruptrix TaxID=252970 RepID=UPI002869D517|nr:hypothetical protein [Paraburkholderia phenoliruptrix]WMY08080.1 hypothetical protein P3F88_17705 [Paraburkholderia phenoliruptrix]
MNLEQVLEEAAYARPGYSLVAFKEAALPNYLLTTRLITLEKKALGPIEEACLGAVDAGLADPDDISSFLGLSRVVLNSVLAGLNTNECINYSRPTDWSKATVTLTEKGRTTLRTMHETVPQETVVKFVFDPYQRKIRFVSTTSLFRPGEVRERGWYEVPLCGAKRPDVEDIPLNDIDKVLQKLPRRDEGSRELLAARRIERREMHFLPCIMLFYRALASEEVQVAFYLEDGFSLEHENVFRELGGPKQAGANFALEAPEMPQLGDLVEGLGGQQRVDELLSIEREIATSATPETAESVKTNVSLAATAASDEPPSRKGASRLRAMTQRCIRMHEHPGLLKKALTGSKSRLLIVSPWITHQVIDNMFVMSLEALLRNGVEVTVAYGLADEDGTRGPDKANQKPAITQRAERELSDIQRRFDNFKLVFLGNTHRKLLVSDNSFAVVTSFNWLSFRGDPGKKARDEFGFLVTEPEDVEAIFQDGTELVAEGYSGPSEAKSRVDRKR